MALDPSQVPLPDEIPSDLNLRSASIETLIAQNEDLMSRLTVNIRRNHLLEQQITRLQQSEIQLKQSLNSISDQFLILKNKDDLWRQKYETIENQNLSLKDEILLWKTKTEEASQHTRLNREKYKEKLELAQKNISRFRRYRLRIDSYVKPLIKNLKNSLLQIEETHQSEIKKVEKNHQLTISHLEAKLKDKTTQVDQLRDNITQLSDYIKNQSHQNSLEIYQKEIEYTEKINHLTSKNHELTNENQRLKQIAEQMDHIMTNCSVFENRAIYAERARDELQKRWENETKSLQEKVFGHARDLGDLKYENSNLKIQNSQLIENNSSLLNQKNDLTEQIENLQFLWDTNANDVNLLNQKIEQLQKLNRELASHLTLLKRKTKENPELKSQELETLIINMESGYPSISV